MTQPLSAQDVRACPQCGAVQYTVAAQWNGTTHYRWTVCPCREAMVQASAERQQARRAVYEQQRAAALLGDDGLAWLHAQQYTLEQFRPQLLRTGPDGAHVYDVATRWLNNVLRYGDHAVYHDPNSPPSTLLFTSPVRGCGKTHLASALGLHTRAVGKLVVFVEEGRYLRQYWGSRLEEQQRLVTLPAERAWLTIIDDLGKRRVRRDQGSDSTTVADAWDAVISRRWERGGWTIITTNYTPDELLERGTINLSTYSRLAQMTAQQYQFFDGRDQRLYAEE